MVTRSPQKVYQEYQERFRDLNDTQLISAFNREVGNSGWTNSRAAYMFALHQEFKNRKYDYSDIGDNDTFSLKKRIKLVNKKILVEPDQ